MVDPHLLSLWQHLEVSLSSLVDSLAGAIDVDDLQLLREFIEHREYGVALEMLVAFAKEKTIPLDASQEAEIKRLADLMEIDLNSPD